MTNTCDILISGGGIAGLTAAAAFGNAGFSVICVEPTPPVTNAAAQGADLRSTAMLQPAKALLERAGLWDALAPHAAALQVMRIIDAGGLEAEPRVSREFDASEISDAPFGWNFPNWLLRREMLARLDGLDTVDFRSGIGTARLFTREGGAKVTLSDGSRVEAKLVIAADGRNSAMRSAAGIGVHTQRYGQKAIVFAATHPFPHQNVSTEVHRTGGPFTLVPLPDHEGKPCSAIVWMDDGRLANERMEMDTSTFEELASARSCNHFGPLTLVSPRQVWPIITQHAQRLSGERVALIAEAAHVIPPIGAQGLNMSLNDIATLLDLAEQRPEGLGDAAMLEAYHKARYGDITLRVRGIDLLNRTSQAAGTLARDARAAGLSALYGAAPVRKMLMQMGLGMR
ncbi:UbiH/UbiF family hydroxylase [Sulfitobacter donghicola]|uniref:2-octaprenyl-6-methoxyphenyl hydroxylase n=1 Tax=Sulfitobacter donghicola DSW-25 = KCTC 12864 = JCM 14565 TaxID=1300350 RepID=A0A073IJZ1_9RHOB|nr:UbiH/UbiF family hydroxylase [Sulfitobacter donghicola]KEJ90044.1 2-octaprenyl-6-methoxyphenyl hydroxylase [Sulfitobacter donghicola DSW-25 = KCTC 12864 = JCM 14565]KIN66818.1 2-octaprenyl-6-methoxyphenol hydroxylase [Sulfitobacter donghicola DSW-25 = KCTC 12864 = JCM 14565]